MHRRQVSLAPLDQEGWRTALERSHDVPFFSSPEWASVAAGYLGGEGRAWLFRHGMDEYLLPAVVQSGRLGFVHINSMPFGTYPGLVPLEGAPPPDELVLGRLYAVIRSEVRLGGLTVNLGMVDTMLPQAHTFTTHCVDLQQGEDAVWARMEDATRNQVRQAVRHGVQIRRNNERSSFEKLYEFTLASLPVWGRGAPPYSWDMFERIWRVASGALGSHVSLWEATHDGIPLAYALVFYGRREAFYWAGAMDRGLSRFRGSSLLQWTIIRDACSRGVSLYNMGASGSLEGVARFKVGFGAEERSCSSLCLRSRLLTLLENLRKAVQMVNMP